MNLFSISGSRTVITIQKNPPRCFRIEQQFNLTGIGEDFLHHRRDSGPAPEKETSGTEKNGEKELFQKSFDQLFS